MTDLPTVLAAVPASAWQTALAVVAAVALALAVLVHRVRRADDAEHLAVILPKIEAGGPTGLAWAAVLARMPRHTRRAAVAALEAHPSPLPQPGVTR